MKLQRILSLVVGTLTAALMAAGPAAAQAPTKVKFTLDWRFEAPAAPYFLAQGKGYFDQEKISIDIDAGGGSGQTVTRVASGTYDMGFADLATVMEFQANNPTAPAKPVGVMMIYNNAPMALYAMKKSGIAQPADLKGKKLGGPQFDAVRRAFPIFAKANGIDASAFTWTTMDPALRETMLVRGDVDVISGFTFYTPQSLGARGAKPGDYNTIRYADNGVRLYGNAVIVNEAFAKKNPEVVKGVLRAIARGYRDTVKSPEEAVAYLKKREPLINEEVELSRTRALVEMVLMAPDSVNEGFGRVSPPRVSLMAAQVSDAFNTKTRVNAATVFDASYLPAAAELDFLRKPR
ncbi:MAG: ABC transporter substrate-binding protein [Burkholderiales bacterium]|nr:ABC transporter substrate-binding protein [Burkholderiales bacterium]